MKLSDVPFLRLHNQQIIKTEQKTIGELVYTMGAFQAQDYTMAKWAVGARLSGSTEAMVETAIDNAEIIRTHVLRPTWHIISARDIYWMLELTAPQIRTAMRSSDNALGLTDTIMKKSQKVIEKALLGGYQLTRDDLVMELQKAKINTQANRVSHILMRAEVDGLICSGKRSNRKQTYALLEERVPFKTTKSKDEALAELATRYFTSRSPATLKDFIWWSGLPVREARRAVEMLGPGFASVVINEMTYWHNGSSCLPGKKGHAAFLLPAFDEYIIAYTDRSASLPSQHSARAVSTNGVFRPVIVIEGQVAGIWKRTVIKDKMLIETQFFQSPDVKNSRLIEKEAERIGRFFDKRAEVKIGLYLVMIDRLSSNITF